MPGWSEAKRRAVEDAFYKFLDHCYVNSRDAGRICLGTSLYSGQRRAVTAIFDALEDDVHDIYILKSRQLGMSTLIRSLSIFMLGIHNGLKGAIVFDSAENRNESRSEIEVMINELPGKLKFPLIASNNRSGLTLSNDSKVLFMSAGVKRTKTSGTLGRSVGLSLAHCSEICSWDNDEGMEAFRNSLSDINPDRLYIWESTARGFNQWNDIWEEARRDEAHCKCIFLGWWSKETQVIPREHRDFRLYGETPPSDEEIRKIKDVKQLYNHDITLEQLAWIRRKMDPSAQQEGDASPEFEGDPTRVQEQPWTEREAFQQTGSVFFAPEKLTEQSNKWVSHDFSTYMYITLDEFAYTEVLKAPNAKMIELKVWDAPSGNDAVYVVGVDPAFGTSESNARSCIQVCRCYADGIDQVAEYAWPLITAQHLGWVVASLLGWYGSRAAEVRYALELNGPGMAVFSALKSLKYQLEHGYQPKDQEKGLVDVFKNVKTYIYSRVDSMGGGYNYHIKTTRATKSSMLEQLRNVVSTGKLRVRSADTIREMSIVTRDKNDGDVIGVPAGRKDDRVMALAFAVHCWEEKIRRNLINTNRTREAEATRKNITLSDQVYMFQQNQLTQFFKEKRMQRINYAKTMQRAAWRYR